MRNKINQIVFYLIIINLGVCSTLSAEVIDRIVAIVDNDIVTLVQLNKEVAPYKQQIESSGYSEEKKKEMLQAIDKKTLNSMVDRSLTQQEAKKYRIVVSDQAIDNAVENVKKHRGLSQEEFDSVLEREGLTLETYRETVKGQILQSRLINHAVKSKVIITESDIKQYYDTHIDTYTGKKKHHLRNILMADEDKIHSIRKKLDKKTKFVTLAKRYSAASNASDGGNLGLFDIQNFSQEIKDSISPLNKGDYTKVISTSQGFQIFYVEDIVLEGNKTLEQAQDEIREILYREQVDKKFETWLESLKKNAHIKIML